MILPPVVRLRTRSRGWRVCRRSAGWLTRYKLQPWPEGLEDRTLLSSITEYPIPPGPNHVSLSLFQITAGSNTYS